MNKQNSIRGKSDSKRNLPFSVRKFGYVYDDYSWCLLANCVIFVNLRLIGYNLPHIVPKTPYTYHFKRF